MGAGTSQIPCFAWSIALLALAAGAGFLLGRHQAEHVTPLDATRLAPDQASSLSPHGDSSGESGLSSLEIRSRIGDLIAASPMLSRDWETRMQIERLLRGVPVATFAEWHEGISRMIKNPVERNGLSYYEGSYKGFFNQPVRDLIYKAWAGKDGRAATEAAYSFGIVSPFASKILYAWAERDPLAAYEWSLTDNGVKQAPSPKGNDIPRMMFEILARKDFEEAKRRVLTGDAKVQGELLPLLFNGCHGDFGKREELFKIADTLPGKEGVFTKMIERWALSSPNEAIERIATLDLPEEGKAAMELSALNNVSVVWKFPDAVKGWFERHRDEAEVPQQVTRLMEGWLAVDPVGSVEWLNRFPPGDQRDRAFSALRQGMGRDDEDPFAADGSTSGSLPRVPNYVASIQNDELRRGLYQDHFLRLAGVDKGAALEWREKLPEDDRPSLDAE